MTFKLENGCTKLGLGVVSRSNQIAGATVGLTLVYPLPELNWVKLMITMEHKRIKASSNFFIIGGINVLFTRTNKRIFFIINYRFHIKEIVQYRF